MIKNRWIPIFLLCAGFYVFDIGAAFAATHTVNVSCTQGFDLDGNGTYEVMVNTRSKTIAAGDTLNITYNNCTDSFANAYAGQEAAHYTDYCGSFSPTPPSGDVSGLGQISLTYTAKTVPTGGKTPAYCASGAAPNGDHIQYLNSLSPQLTIYVTGMSASDTTAPRVTSIVRQIPASSPTANDTVTWRVTFDESVQNVDATDFTATGTTATVAVSQVNASTYDVTLSGGDLANLNGTVTLGFAGGQNIQDLAGNALANTTPTGTNNNSFVIANDTTNPTVQIQNAPTSLSNQNAFNVTFQFSETVTGFALGDIGVGNGSASNFVAVDGDTYTADITPDGGGNVTIDVAANVTQDLAGNPNTAATQATVTCGVGCGSAATIQATQSSIRRFISQRIRNMTAQGPGISGFLTGDGLGGGFNGIGGGPVGLNYAGQGGIFSGNFSSSLQQFSRFKSNAGAEGQGGSSTPMPANIWVKGRWTRTKDDRGGFNEKSDLGIVYLGADYRFSDDLLIGIMGQVDWAEQKSAVQGLEAEGDGWMIGPYMVKRLSGNSIMDLRLAWGQSDNKIRPTGTYWDRYDTERWQIEGNLTGNFDKGNWNIAPILGLNYFKETQKAYTDSNGFLIGEQDVELGTLSFGPTLTYRMQGNDGLQMRPFVGIQGVWDFKAPDVLDLNGIATGTEELRAKVRLGLNLISRRGLTFQASYSYDGIGLSDYESQTGELAVNLPLSTPGLAKGTSLRGFYSLQNVSTFTSDDLQQAKLELNIPF